MTTPTTKNQGPDKKLFLSSTLFYTHILINWKIKHIEKCILVGQIPRWQALENKEVLF